MAADAYCARRQWGARLALAGFAWLLGVVLGRAEPLTLITYNLRYASDTPPHAWPDRRPLVRDVIRQAAPDVLGTQEGLYRQLRELAEDLPEYEWIGLGRGGGSFDEFTAIFFRSARLEPLAFDHLWLSDTPKVIGSITWEHRYRRMATWVRFRDRVTGQVFTVWNVHFDHEVQVAREQSAQLLLRETRAQSPGEPVVLLGDFNAAAERNPVYDRLVGEGGFRDSWREAGRREGEGRGTFNAFGSAPETDERIDWILLRGPARVQSAAILAPVPQAQPVYPSDHYAVVAQVTWLEKRSE